MNNTNASLASNKEETSSDPPLKIDTSIFKDHINQKFKHLLTTIGGDNQESKLIIMDDSLFDIFKQFEIKANVRLLKEDIKTNCEYLLIFTTPYLENMHKISKIIRNHQDRSVYIIFSPKRTLACKEALQNLGIYHSITSVHDFSIDLVPLDSDILSLEIPDASRQIYLEDDMSSLMRMAESLQKLEVAFGGFGQILGKGNSAKIILEKLKDLKNDEKSESGEIDCLVILDRNVDFVTPMLTQLTYVGLMDEIWGIKQNNLVQLEKRFFPLTKGLPRDQEKINYKLKNDAIFKEITDCNLPVVNTVLEEKVVEIKSLQKDFAEASEKGDTTIKATAGKMQKARKLLEKDDDKVATHLEILNYLDELMAKPSFYKRIKSEHSIVDELSKVQETIDFLESQILNQIDLAKVLRILCLQSLADGGIYQVALDTIKRNIIQAYGFQHLGTFFNLEKTGILKKEGEKKTWEKLNKQLGLVNPELKDLRNLEDASFVYEGFCPVIVRLVEQIFKKDGWKGLDLLPGATIFEEEKRVNNNVIMVCVMGGITYGEIAGIRYLAKKYGKEIVIVTTGIISGDRFISSFYDKKN